MNPWQKQESMTASLFIKLNMSACVQISMLNRLFNLSQQKLTELFKDEMAASTSSSEENVTNPYPLDFEVPGTLETFALRTFPFSEKKFLSISVVTVLARFPT